MNKQTNSLQKLLFIASLIFGVFFGTQAQQIQWSQDGSSYFTLEKSEIVRYQLPSMAKSLVLKTSDLTPKGAEKSLTVENFTFSKDEKKILIFTNSKKVWRYNTRGDYWVFDTSKQTLKQLGSSKPISSLMFAKFSPDGKKVAYVSEFNLFVEDTETSSIKALTNDGNRKLINGTFDWAYEEEFFCRDGFRWSPDSKKIAFWQIDAQTTKDYLMVNNTAEIYPKPIPVEYPVAGEKPSTYKIGVVNIETAKNQWMQIPDDAVLGTYVPRMEWAASSNELILQHLNRKQNESKLLISNALTGDSKVIYTENDAAWIDILPLWDEDYSNGGWDWINNGKEFIWASEKDGWRHLYRVSKDGKTEKLITNGAYDVMNIDAIDEAQGYIYFHASPKNATQKYLYRTKLNGEGKLEKISPENQVGTHHYDISPDAKFAMHRFSNYFTPSTKEWISIPNHQSLDNKSKIDEAIAKGEKAKPNIEFFPITTKEGVTMDAWMVKPNNFDAKKIYPIVFYVYTEPWGQNVKDTYGVGNNNLYKGNMSTDEYIYVSIDNRGTPVPKGREWRKSVYRKIGQLNISDQALAAEEILKLPYIDQSRVAVWGWSGGGSATLNLMFQYPEIYKTGIAIAAVGNQLTYDNIYQERYMGLPQENKEDFEKGSPITHVKGLKGHLLYIHGTGDDNVHYNNAEMLIDELVKNGKQFQLMLYPNRSHSISEGVGTKSHLSGLFTEFLKEHCPPGAVSKSEK
jgi:dipeptidyl-peptidase 4